MIYLETITDRPFLALFPQFSINTSAERICNTITRWKENIGRKALGREEPDSESVCFPRVWRWESIG